MADAAQVPAWTVASGWKTRQDSVGGGDPTPEEAPLYWGLDCTGSSCPATIDEKYRGIDGKFKFKLVWPELFPSEQVWKQSTNPTGEGCADYVEGYEPVDAPYFAGGGHQVNRGPYPGFGGLLRSCGSGGPLPMVAGGFAYNACGNCVPGPIVGARRAADAPGGNTGTVGEKINGQDVTRMQGPGVSVSKVELYVFEETCVG